LGPVVEVTVADATVGTAAVTRAANAQPATGHSPSSDVVSMMRPSATQAAP
jgi:hypothetical protein